MRILIVSENYPSKYNITFGLFVYKLTQELCVLGHDVTVVAPVHLKFKLNSHFI